MFLNLKAAKTEKVRQIFIRKKHLLHFSEEQGENNSLFFPQVT